MRECPGCGAPLKFDIASQKMLCDYCQTAVEPEKMDSMEATEENFEEGFYETTIFSCPRCGGSLSSDVNEASVFCPYCGNSTLLEGRLSKRKRPRFVIPFKVTKEDCVRSYKKLLRRSLYAPDSLRKEGVINSFRGIYMPHWYFTTSQKGFDASLNGYTRSVGLTSYSDYIYDCNFNLDARYEGFSYDASELFDDQISIAIAPYDMEDRKDFAPGYLSGFYADTYDVDSQTYRENAVVFSIEETMKRMKKDPIVSGYKVFETNQLSTLERRLNTKVESSDIAMMPVWFMSCQYKDRLAYVGINGQTGKAAGIIPASPLKYVLFSLLSAIPLFFLINFISFPTPPTAMLIANILALFVYLTFDRELLWTHFYAKAGRVQEFEDGTPVTPKLSAVHKIARVLMIAAVASLWIKFPAILSDIAITFMMLVLLFSSIHDSLKKLSIWNFSPGKRFGFLLIPLGGIAIVVTHIINPVSDLVYYGMCIFQIVASCLTFIDLIHYHNILATRPMPQFQRKGGDDNAAA